MWFGFWRDLHDKIELVNKDDMSEADLETGGKLLPSQGGKFKRKKPSKEDDK